MIMTLTHKEMTRHIRSRLSAAGIKAHCSKYEACGTMYIRIEPPNAEARFTDEHSVLINRIAKVNGLTGSQGSPIDENLINSVGRHFEFGALGIDMVIPRRA